MLGYRCLPSDNYISGSAEEKKGKKKGGRSKEKEDDSRLLVVVSILKTSTFVSFCSPATSWCGPGAGFAKSS